MDRLTVAYINYVESNYGEMELSCNDIAKDLNVTQKKLERCIKSSLHMTPNVFLMDYRLTSASVKLAGGATIREAYESCGFSSHAYFSKRFKEKHGCTPSDYTQHFKDPQNT